jgi:hypothetical protein
MYCACNNAPNDEHPTRLFELVERNQTLSSQLAPHLVWTRVVELTLALFALELPAYVLLEIVDRLPVLRFAPHSLKIRCIINVIGSCRRVLEQRTPALQLLQLRNQN